LFHAAYELRSPLASGKESALAIGVAVESFARWLFIAKRALSVVRWLVG
jgi:hypothetical protein